MFVYLPMRCLECFDSFGHAMLSFSTILDSLHGGI